ncbi:hypothetical protein WUBG_02871 [Wuchereria bancrofti]|uniref:Uncharacterized protein n=1 Tax=Wuchereria bancrofti TaxID=6293 RepID=J9EUF7_WUCBA|nr:hypothetical protein WUBG_02871 [Wuchereria bancrofti]
MTTKSKVTVRKPSSAIRRLKRCLCQVLRLSQFYPAPWRILEKRHITHGTRTFAEILLGNVPSATRETNFSGEDVENGSTGEIREEFKGLKKANLTQRKVLISF